MIGHGRRPSQIQGSKQAAPKTETRRAVGIFQAHEDLEKWLPEVGESEEVTLKQLKDFYYYYRYPPAEIESWWTTHCVPRRHKTEVIADIGHEAPEEAQPKARLTCWIGCFEFLPGLTKSRSDPRRSGLARPGTVPDTVEGSQAGPTGETVEIEEQRCGD
eukprot:s1658_g2.t1